MALQNQKASGSIFHVSTPAVDIVVSVYHMQCYLQLDNPDILCHYIRK